MRVRHCKYEFFCAKYSNECKRILVRTFQTTSSRAYKKITFYSGPCECFWIHAHAWLDNTHRFYVWDFLHRNKISLFDIKADQSRRIQTFNIWIIKTIHRCDNLIHYVYIVLLSVSAYSKTLTRPRAKCQFLIRLIQWLLLSGVTPGVSVK